MRRNFVWTAAALTACLAACSPGRNSASGPPEDVFIAPAAPPSSRYVVDARIDVASGTVEGRETVRLKNTAAFPLRIIAFDWAVGASSTLEVSVRGRRIFPPEGSGEAPVPKPVPIVLPEPLAPGASLELDVAFRQGPGDSRKRAEFLSSSLCPRLWWDGLAHHGSFSVKLEVPEGMAVAASGRLDPRTGRYEAEAVRSFGAYVASGLRTASREADGVLVTALFTEKGAKAAAVCLETAADAVRFFKAWLGFYPHTFLNIIPGGAGRWGGYPVATGIVAIHGQETYVDGEPPLHWQHITSHEIGHEYWGEWVLDADRPDWVWIAMGIFADTEYMTVRGFDPERASSWTGNYRRAVPMHYDMSLDAPPDREERAHFDFNNTVVHSKGPAVVFALDTVLGRDVFLRVYKRVLRDHAGRPFGWRDLRAAAEAESGQSLGWFFDDWVRSNRYLCYGVEKGESRADGEAFATEVRIVRRGTMSMPMPVLAVFADGATRAARADRTRAVTALTFRSQAPLKDVVLDPAGRLARLEEPIAEISPEAAAALAFGSSPAEAGRIYEAVKDEPISSGELWYRLGLDLYEVGRPADAEACFGKVVAANAHPVRVFGAQAWLGLLNDLRGRRAEALAHYRAALAVEPPQSLRHDQFKLKLDRAWLEERLKTPYVPGQKARLPDRPTAEQLIEFVGRMDWEKEGETPLLVYRETAGLTIEDSRFWFKLGLLLYDSRFDRESLAAFLKTSELEKTGVTAFAALVWQGHMNDLLGRRDEALARYKDALAIDPGTAMMHSQWRMTVDRAWVEARRAAPFVRR